MATPSREDLPEVVRTVCDAHAALLDERLPGLLEGLYLHGSVGFDGEFHGGSDIDFVAVTSRRPDDGEVDVLRQVHAELDKRRPEPAYDGFYVVADDLAGSPDVVPDVPGVLHQWFDVGTHCDVKHITWRELRDHGITVRGKALRDLVIWSDDAALHASTRENLDTYWRSQLEAMHHHPREASLPQAAEWGALGAPRLVHLLLTGTPTSKSGAGRWALDAYAHHREVVEEALRVRERPDDPSTYAADPDRRRRDLIAFMGEVIADGVAMTTAPQRRTPRPG
ncbi:nucleotidyltransferase domain-containing protein [Terrabacter sp. MAHUQ-38]|uniref:nucleotidyltransferase domain-containing protein n=1 Tax=unclassified Terrabacter TaxID=2630222 RepID=UPI00165E7093|nr:nucleotidyltransferase domain-containing protein [Terrabacter sp. MAHUQ-38]MBC9822226.1 nucleotidyltransferase domain-containing protein [Terrabacter sp. MAHUQ-38]